MALVDNTNIRRGIMVPKYIRNCDFNYDNGGWYAHGGAVAVLERINVTIYETSDLIIHGFATAQGTDTAMGWGYLDLRIYRNAVELCRGYNNLYRSAQTWLFAHVNLFAVDAALPAAAGGTTYQIDLRGYVRDMGAVAKNWISNYESLLIEVCRS